MITSGLYWAGKSGGLSGVCVCVGGGEVDTVASVGIPPIKNLAVSGFSSITVWVPLFFSVTGIRGSCLEGGAVLTYRCISGYATNKELGCERV